MSDEQKNNIAHLREVVLPDAARDLVPAQVKGAELDLGDRQLLRGCRGGQRQRRASGGVHRRVPGAQGVSVNGSDSLGCCVGLCCDRRSSLSMCSSVVLPALSRPRKRILAFLCAKPAQPRSLGVRQLATAGCH